MARGRVGGNFARTGAAWHAGVRMARRPVTRTDEILHRLRALEERLERLEAGKAPPGDGRAASPRNRKPVVRCTGCGLPLRRRAGRRAECGLPLSRIRRH